MMFNSNSTQISGSVIVENTPVPPTNKKRKWLIIGGIAIFVLIIVVVMVLILVNNEKTETYETAFNRYANYILYEKDTEDSLKKEYNATEKYTIDEVTYGDMKFFDNAQELFDNFLNLYHQSNVQTDEIDAMIEEQEQAFDFLKQYYTVESFDDDEILNIYVTDGAEKAKIYAKNIYAEMEESSSSYSKEYAEAGIRYNEWLVGFYELENKYGCIVDGEELVECDYEEVYGSFDLEDVFIMQEIFAEADSTVIENCWRIAREFDVDVPEIQDEDVDEEEEIEDYDELDDDINIENDGDVVDEEIDFNEVFDDEEGVEYYYDEEDDEYYNEEEEYEYDGTEILFD